MDAVVKMVPAVVVLLAKVVDVAANAVVGQDVVVAACQLLNPKCNPHLDP